MCNRPKQTISASGEFGLLLVVAELDIGLRDSEDAMPLRWVNCEIPHRLEMGTKHSL